MVRPLAEFSFDLGPWNKRAKKVFP
jgi:hypothetical protein